MNQADLDLLKTLAQRYIWWKTPDEAIRYPEHIVAQIMDMGDYADVQMLVKQVGDDVLCKILTNAEIGQFNARSWTYWHYRLGLSELDNIPPMPIRKLHD